MHTKFASASVVVPVFNERESLVALAEKIEEQIAPVVPDWEIVFVDDGSTDGSAEVLDDLAQSCPGRIVVVHFRGNFGKSAALAAGFKVSLGEAVITLDADLQDDPREIPRCLDLLAAGYDVVSGYKKRRRDPLHKVVLSRIFNLMVRWFSETSLHDVNCGLKAYRREVLDELTIYGELHRFIPVLASWRRFRVGELVVTHHPRRTGRSKFGISRYFHGLTDLITIGFLSRYERRPSYLFSMSGLFLAGIGFLVCLYLTILWLLGSRPIGDRPLLLLGILLLVVGSQFVGLGLIAELSSRRLNMEEEPYSIREVIAGKATDGTHGSERLAGGGRVTSKRSVHTGDSKHRAEERRH